MKKILSIAVCLTLVSITFSGCFNKSNDDKLNIGVVQLVEHPALDEAYRGFVDGLKENGYIENENIIINYNNAQGSQTNTSTIADKLVNERSDLILAIATSAAQAVANKTKDIPILITAVTDPADAKLVKSNEDPQTNVTGTSDLNPINKQIELLKRLKPDAKNVGILYSSSESNSKLQADIAKKELEKLGIKGIDFTVSNTNDVQLVVQSMVSQVDAVYVPTDNVIASAISTVTNILNDKNIPTIVSDGNLVENGALATYGIDYYKIGKQTASMAVKILRGESKPQDMAIEYIKEVELIINRDIVERLKITVPEDLKQQAKMVNTK